MRGIFLALVMVWLGGVALAGDATQAPANASGMRAYVDPETGEFTPDGPPLEMPGPQTLPLATEEDSPVAGKMVRLNGQFMSAVVAHIGPDGTERIECVTPDGAVTPHVEP